MTLRRIIQLIFALGLFWPTMAWSQTCSFAVSAMNFGSVDTLSGTPTNSTATMNVNCSGGLVGQRILICPNLGAGSGGATAAARQMLSGANVLNYQLYSDPARSVVWGTYNWAFPPRAPAFALTLGLLGTGSGSATIYGDVFGSQANAPPGSYLSSFSSSPNVEFRYRVSASSNNCNTSAGSLASPSFNVTTIVSPNCLVATQNVDFGNKGVLDQNADATGAVSVTCTPGNAYTIGLGNGQSGTSPTARRMTLGAQGVTYGLYRDQARSQPWGNTIGSNTVAGTGAGMAQNITVYGRVPSQTTPSPGTYTDTVVVTVTY